MMKRLTPFLMVAALAFCLPAAAQTPSSDAHLARLLRFPTVSADRIAFSYAGDLYVVPIQGGAAQRLTSHVGFEVFPKFSPNGQELAFTGQYDGNTEVYSIPVTGGEPKRLTWSATVSRDNLGDRMGPNNIVMAWTPDGKDIIYRSKWESFGGLKAKLHRVSAQGGPAQELPLAEGSFCSFNAKGSLFAFNRMFREFRTWKYYRGGQADDIWITDLKSNRLDNITHNPAQDIFPMWIGEEIFFASDRDRTMNIFVYNTRTKETAKVTHFTEFDVKFPSANQGKIVFENGGYIYLLDAKTKEYKQVPITLQSDGLYARSQWMDFSRYPYANYDLNPDGSHALISAGGDVFNVTVGEGLVYNLTQSSDAHDRSACWSPDGKTIAWLSDKSGEYEVWVSDVHGKHAKQITRGTDNYIHGLQWSRDGKSLFMSTHKGDLIQVFPSGETRLLVHDVMGSPRGFDLSPDGKWLAYGETVENNMDVINVKNLENGQVIRMTEKWFDSYSPLFSEDGRYLFFTSRRSVRTGYASMEMNVTQNFNYGLYAILLQADTPSPVGLKDGDAPAAPMAKPEPKKEAKDGKEAEKDKGLRIDQEGLIARTVALPVTESARAFYAPAGKVYYTAGGEVKILDLNSLKSNSVGKFQLLATSANHKKALIRDRDRIGVSDLGGMMSMGKEVKLDQVRGLVDFAQRWEQIYYESWRIFRDCFYVEDMHGVDWQAMRDKYAPLLPYVKHRHDLTYVIGELIGELNVGHAYVTSGSAPAAGRFPTGLLGARFSRDAKTGYFKVEKILPGETWNPELCSPLSQPGQEVKVGEYILAINNLSCADLTDIYQGLVGTVGKMVALTVNGKPSLEGARQVLVKPIGSEARLCYYEYVKTNMEKVEKATNGQVGYIHIPDMSLDGYDMFAKLFYSQLDKKALIIDDRGNGGGNVSPIILERLSREVYRMNMYRNNERKSTVPNQTHYGPKVCLIDKYSSSDGDLFPYSFRRLGLGKLIGTRTWGGIVGISGSLPFVDGQDLRTPFFTSYSSETGDWIVEGHGVDPDIVVDNNPYDEYQGRDAQLTKAIEVALEELKSWKELPPIPAKGPEGKNK